MKKPLQGFTIIELIVVIAIIAVLAGIIAIAASQKISKSKMIGIKNQLGSIPALVVKYTLINGSAVGFCSTQEVTNIANSIKQIKSNQNLYCYDKQSGYPTQPDPNCSDDQWFVIAQGASGEIVPCIDSDGQKTENNGNYSTCHCIP